MQDLRIKFDYMLDALSGVTAGSWLRLALLILFWVNMGVALFIVPSNTMYVALSFALAVSVTAWAFWKNNSFTHKAQRADNLNLKNAGFCKLVLNLSKVSVGTWTRLILMVISLLNIALVAFNQKTINVEVEELYTCVSVAMAFIVGLINYWKNNSFTVAAQAADDYYHKICFPDEDSLLDFDTKLGIDDIFALSDSLTPEAVQEKEDYKKFEYAAEKVMDWAEKNPDKVDELEEKLKCNLTEFLGKLRDKAEEGH